MRRFAWSRESRVKTSKLRRSATCLRRGKAQTGLRPRRAANAADGALPRLGRKRAMRQESRKPNRKQKSDHQTFILRSDFCLPIRRIDRAGPGSDPFRVAWCLRTKEQGFPGGEAPRPNRQRPIRSEWRGASGRRNKGFREVKHHAPTAEVPFDPSGVVPPDEGTRVSGR